MMDQTKKIESDIQLDLLNINDFDKADPLVYKRNELIHGHYDISAMALKVMDAILTNVSPYEDTVHPINLTVSEIARLLGMARQTLYGVMDDVISELMNIDLKVPYIDEDWEASKQAERIKAQREGRAPRNIPRPAAGTSWTYIKLFDRTPVDNESHILTFIFHRRVHSYISNLRGNYTYYSLQHTSSMSGKYTLRLYALFRSALSLKDVKSGKTRAIKDIDYLELRKILGIKDTSYKHFSRFASGILDNARNEFESKNCDIQFFYTTPNRVNARSAVKTIRFVIDAHIDLGALEGELANDYLIDWQAVFVKTFTDKAQAEARSLYSEQRIKRNVEYLVLKQSEGLTKIASPRSWLRKALLEDYAGVAALTDGRYPNDLHKGFIDDQLKHIWHKLDDVARDEFLEIGFDSPLIGSMLSAYIQLKERALSAKQARVETKSENRRMVTQTILGDVEDNNLDW